MREWTACRLSIPSPSPLEASTSRSLKRLGFLFSNHQLACVYPSVPPIAHPALLMCPSPLLPITVHDPSKALQRSSTLPRSSALARRLLKETLPWLPAYDRRDVLVVHAVLSTVISSQRGGGDDGGGSGGGGGGIGGKGAGDGINGGGHGCSNGMNGKEARVVAATGGGSSSSRPSRGWDVCRQAKHSEAHHRDRLYSIADELRLRSQDGAHRQSFQALATSAYAAALLDTSSGDAVNGRSMRSWLQEKGLEPITATASMDALHDLGWLAQRGGTCTLSTPLGKLLSLPPPEGDYWRLSSLRTIPQADRGRLALVLIITSLLSIVAGFLIIVISAFTGLGERPTHHVGTAVNAVILVTGFTTFYSQAICFTFDFGMPPHLTDPRQAAQPMGYGFKVGVGLRCVGALLYSAVLLPVAWRVYPPFFESFEGIPLASELVEHCPATWEGPGWDAATGNLNSCFLLQALAIFHIVLSCLCCSMMATASTFHMVWRGVSEGAQYFLRPRDEYASGMLIVDEGAGSSNAAAASQSFGGRVFAAAASPSNTRGVRGAAVLQRGAAGPKGFNLDDVSRGLQSRNRPPVLSRTTPAVRAQPEQHLPLPTRTTSPIKAPRPLSSPGGALPPPSPMLPPTPWQAAKPRPDVVFYV